MYAYLALAALQLVGGFQQADIIRKNGELQNSIADMNSQFADLDAFNAIAHGQGTAAKAQSQVDQVQGADKAAYASENVDVKYGTARDVEADNRIAGLNNTLQIQRQAQNMAAGYKAQAINMRLGGQMGMLQANLNASSAQSAGVMGALQTGITGYAYGQSTGKGNASRTGTDSKPQWDKISSIHMTNGGDGIRAPAFDVDPQSGMGWYPDPGREGSPGFYGKGQREDYSDAVV